MLICQDADLIMLALATHEPNFRVLREDVFAQGSTGPRVCKKCGVEGHVVANCKGKTTSRFCCSSLADASGQAPPKDPNVVEKAKPVDPKPFIFLDVSVLREYLAVELRVPTVPFPFDQELAIDDWIFMIFFVGNDFLPHLPSLEIREGAIDALLKIWKSELPRMGGYLTNHGKVDLARAQVILDGLAKNEDSIFQKRREGKREPGSRNKADLQMRRGKTLVRNDNVSMNMPDRTLLSLERMLKLVDQEECSSMDRNMSLSTHPRQLEVAIYTRRYPLDPDLISYRNQNLPKRSSTQLRNVKRRLRI
jgi:5'-3' exoribonuclease 2